jgi:hypothetical protein
MSFQAQGPLQSAGLDCWSSHRGALRSAIPYEALQHYQPLKYFFGLTISDPESRSFFVIDIADKCTRERNNFTTEGIFSLGLEQNLDLIGNGLYGYDTVTLGYLGSGLPALNHQVVAGKATQDFWLGQFGVNPAASNFSSFDNPVESYSKCMPLIF